MCYYDDYIGASAQLNLIEDMINGVEYSGDQKTLDDDYKAYLKPACKLIHELSAILNTRADAHAP